jgi:beta-lactamase regulating signal transducer with metallopeptidase domain
VTYVFGVLAQPFALTIGAAVAVRFVGRAAVRHAIWTAATIGCLVTPIASGYMPNVRVPLPRSFQHDAPAATQATPTSGANVTRAARTREIDALDGVSLRTAVVKAWPVSLAALWLLGTCVLLGRAIVSVSRARRLVRRAAPVRSPTLLSAYETVRRDHGFATRAALLTTPSLVSAATFGVFRPVVLLPADAADWSHERVHAVLAHELAHIARHDCLTQLLVQFARALYWFNPLMWFAERRMAVERERACDDMVMGSGVSATAYAAALVDAVRRARTWQMAIPSSVITMAGASELEMCVRRILHSSHAYTRLGWFKRAAIATSCAAYVLLVASVRLGSAQPASVLQPNTREPDLLGDSVASPTSERLLRVIALDSLSLRAVRAGADSVLAAKLVKALQRVPTWEGDLVQERALWALSQAKNGELVEPLIVALGDADWRVRAYAAWALAYSGDRRATARLVEQLEQPVWRLRAMAAHAPEMLADPAARSAMIGRLQDPAWQVRFSAVNYLGALGDAALQPLIRARADDRHVMVRSAVERALTQDESR